MTDIRRPGTLLTAEDLYDIPDDDKQYELVNGVLFVSEPPKLYHGALAVQIAARLDAYVRPRRLGIVACESGYVLRRGPDTVRGPDVSLVRRDRQPSADRDAFVEGPPDLVAEIVSLSDRRGKIAEKVENYLASGTRLVWVVYPTRRQVVVHRPDGVSEVVGVGGALDGRDVVPGFSLPLAELFAVLDD